MAFLSQIRFLIVIYKQYISSVLCNNKTGDDMKLLKRSALFFITGAIGYATIEILWRGYTHPAMMLAGGISFISFSFIAKRLKSLPLLIKAAIGATAVTAIELVFGIICNIWLSLGIWDYSTQPFNLLGQICPLFSLMWCGLAIMFIPLADRMNRLFI